MLVRQLTVDDLAALRALHRFGMTESPLGFVDVAETDAARPDEEVAAMLARGEGWGVFEGERLMGKLTIDALPYPSLAHTFWVHAVYVHPDARGRGASAALMAAAIDAARAKGARRVALWVNERNIPARRFYERFGFVLTGRIPGGIRVGGDLVDDVLMSLDLSGGVASAPLDGTRSGA
jgi:GNAT superfamily N-acetyltransferase